MSTDISSGVEISLDSDAARVLSDQISAVLRQSSINSAKAVYRPIEAQALRIFADSVANSSRSSLGRKVIHGNVEASASAKRSAIKSSFTKATNAVDKKSVASEAL